MKIFHHKFQKLWEEALLLLISAFNTAFYDCVFYTSEIISVEVVTASLKVSSDLTVEQTSGAGDGNRSFRAKASDKLKVSM